MIDKDILLNHSKVIGIFKDSSAYRIDYVKMMSKVDRDYGFKNTDFNETLIQNHINGLTTTEEAIQIMNTKLVNLFKGEKDIDWRHMLSLLGRNNVFQPFSDMSEYVSDKDYWMILGFCYTTSDFAYEESEKLRKWLETDRPYKEFLMNKEDRKYRDSLPDEITIYRGCSIAEINSNVFRFSWTLDKKLAEFFAYDYHRNKNIECSIVKKVIPKSSVIAYFNNRSEEEIIYLG